MNLRFRVSCAEVGSRPTSYITTLDQRGTRCSRSVARAAMAHMYKAPKINKNRRRKLGGRAALVPTAWQNHQLRRNGASRTFRTALLCKILLFFALRTELPLGERVSLWRMEFLIQVQSETNEPAAHYINLSNLLPCSGPQRWRYATRGAVIV